MKFPVIMSLLVVILAIAMFLPADDSEGPSKETPRNLKQRILMLISLAIAAGLVYWGARYVFHFKLPSL